MDNRHNSTFRIDYEATLILLENFSAMTEGWCELLHQLIRANGSISFCETDGREGTLNPLLENHMLSVIVGIARKKQLGYNDTFAEHGTVKQHLYAVKLQNDISRWVTQLNNFLNNAWVIRNTDNSAAKTAYQLKESLEKSLDGRRKLENCDYNQMLRTMNFIQENTDNYLRKVEESGNTDAALSLLVAYLKNYDYIAKAFNSKIVALLEFYHWNILHTVRQGETQDNTYIVITPTEKSGHFTLPEGQLFFAGQNTVGEDLIYQIERIEYISPILCAEMNAIYLTKKDRKATDIRKQAVNFQDTSTVEALFTDEHSEALPLGWTVESSMLVLDEGNRKVSICFQITADIAKSLIESNFPPDSFTLQLSDTKGWSQLECRCHMDMAGSPQCLRFEFMIAQDGAVPTPCTEETHGMTTEYPVLRILTNNENCPYNWVSKLKFDVIEMRTEVTGIRNFTFYNELGEVDTSQSFYPFGIQAEKGAWFLFGNEEMGLKPLQKVRLKGLWKKLPETEAEFDAIYKGYTIAGQAVEAKSFTIATEWQQSGKWNACTGGEQHLFVPDNGEERSLCRVEVIFDFKEDMADPYIYSRDKDGFFRVTLQTPVIGFGTDAYRSLFTETMLHNSRCKEKKRKDLPSEPIVPMLADVELSYIASEKTTLERIENSSIRLRRITALSKEEPFPIDKVNEQPFLPVVPADHLLYFAFLHAQGEQIIRIYLDLVLPKEKIPFYNPQPDKSVKLSWEYWNGNSWQPVPTQSVKVEETCGLTQSGFIEIKLPEKIKDTYTDKQGKAWIRAAVTGDVSSCLAIRNIWTNCIRLTAQNGDGSPLPAGTIQGMEEADERIESIVQPLPGFGGRPAETEIQSAIRQSARIHNRHRALTMKDYEQLVLEHFPEVDKVQCIPVPQDKGASEICLVVFSRAEDSRYCLSQIWKLAEIQRLIRQYAPPFVSMRVINPVYERVKVHCKAVLWNNVQDENKAIRQLVVLAQNYIAPWYRKKEIPALCRSFSYKELHARMVNHEDLMKLVALEVDMERLPHADINEKNPIFKGSHPWSVLLPEIKIELLSPHDGIDEAEIGGNFIIG